MTLQSLEERVQQEWNWLRATIALHPYLSLLVVAVVSGLIGHVV